jgi:pimeloyl-ACP methyl ester carboxylesterase
MAESEDRRIVPDVITTVAKGAGALLAGGVGLGGAWIAYSAVFVNHDVPLPEAIDARRRRFTSSAGGRVSYYADESSDGRPLALIHSVNAAASAYEVRPLFQDFRDERPVYAIDLPGFGFSDRTDRVYFPDLYVDTLIDWIESQLQGQPQPVDVVALSLSAEFAALAALRRPDLFHSLTLISPTGFDNVDRRAGSEQVYRTASFPVWSQAFYDLLTTKRSIRYFLRKTFAGPVDEAMVEYAYMTSHQPAARFAPLYFISGHLFTPLIRDVYGALTTPTLVIANEDEYVAYDALPEFLDGHPLWRAVNVDGAKSLPHFEKAAETVRELRGFWQGLPAPEPAQLEG